MIRVLQYIGSLAQGGSQAMIMNLYRNIDRNQIQFDFVIHADGITTMAEEAESMGAKIYSCPCFETATALVYVKWWNDFFEKHPEYSIIHSHVRSTAAMVLHIGKKHGAVTIAHSHSTSSGRGIKAFIKSILQYGIRYEADYFMGCSQKAGEWLFGKKICDSDKYCTVPNAIDAEKYIYSAEIARKAREELGFAPDDMVLGNVGRLSLVKNQKFLIEIFSIIHNKNKRYKLLIVGDGELRAELEAAISQYGLEDYVTITGMRSDVYRMLMVMDIFVFPSRWEGLGIALIEAQATGCQCIASKNVPEDAKITDLVEFVSLKESDVQWAERILSFKKRERKNMYQNIIDAGYDIKQSAGMMENFYSTISKASAPKSITFRK